MTKPKCANCGTEKIEFFTKTGLRGYICPNAASGCVRSLKGRLRYIEVECHMTIDGPLATFEKLSKTPFEALRKAVRFTVPAGDLLGHANAGILAEIPPERIPNLFSAATALGLATSRTPLESITTLIYGVRNKSIRRLDNIGISRFDPKDAYKKYPNETQDLAWKIYACDRVEELASKITD